MIKNLLKPKLYIENIGNNKSNIIIYPLERGFGHTIGNSLRRVLLSYIPGFAITEVEIEGIIHEYEGKKGVKEDIVNILLNIKDLSIGIINEDIDSELLVINKNEIGPVTANDIKPNNNIKIFNKDHIICNITSNLINLNINMKLQRGIGYNPFNILKKNKNDNNTIIGKLFIDANFNPIKKVSYNIEATRVENKTDLDKLIIYLETNGSVDSEYVIKMASNILIDQFNVLLLNNKDELIVKNETNNYTNSNKLDDKILLKSIDDLELTIRSLNCLKSESIFCIKDLIIKSEDELLKISNLGKKSLSEIKNILNTLNLKLGTKI
ncbi:DNA-directed RNA polymerase subunit alpha [endosymbiont of Pachyrhynchus infernalis]|uniref:DNA-directed RNA polymerase subunit alpha n=1 Tax=endosymbiont of Pachyrhynchus infernalis TaxID=1971488 RepID=UPI000DC6EB17|nr:DNA-directed RNA polymerase subunit alpha [endosymbiont of Pachyrhynchus infernalis]BBA84856.1 DNA-directed RNA polymerase subunit alpha [endosymbiont of Pachyrhynchus infernalis]